MKVIPISLLGRPFNCWAYSRTWKHRWVLLEWTHNLYVLVKISLGSMTALSSVFIAPCSLKLCFYVNVRVTVAVQNKNTPLLCCNFFKKLPPPSAANWGSLYGKKLGVATFTEIWKSSLAAVSVLNPLFIWNFSLESNWQNLKQFWTRFKTFRVVSIEHL